MKPNLLCSSKVSAIGWMLFSAFCLAFMATISYAVATTFDWVTILFARVFINLILVVVLALRTGKPLVFFSAPKNLWIRSITGTISSFGTFYSFTHLPVAESTTIFNTMPLWMVLLVSFVSRERVSASVWAGVVCGITGVVIVQQPHFAEANAAIMAGLGGSIFATVAVYNLHLIKNIHPTTIVAHFSMVACLVIFVAIVPSLYSGLAVANCTREIIIGLLGIGALGTLSQFAMTRAYMLGNPAINSTVGLAQVAFGIGFDILIWNRSFDTVTIIGILMIIIPTVFFFGQRTFGKKSQST